MDSHTLTGREARRQLEQARQRNAPFEQKAREVLEVGQRYLDADNAHLARIDPETGHWEAAVSTHAHDEQFPEGLELDLQMTYCRRTIETADPITLHDAPEQGWEGDPAFETHGLHCYHGTRLSLDGDPYGTVCFVAADPREEGFESEEILFADLVSRLLERELEQQRHEAELTQQTNLVNVLNRVLRHRIRNDMSVIRGRTQLVADELTDPSSVGIALEKIDDLIELCEKARDIEEIVDQDHDRVRTELEPVVQNVVAGVHEKFPEATFSLDAGGDASASLLPSFERAVHELVENAAKHGGDAADVGVSITAGTDVIEMAVTDTGPGLADQERELLDTGVETPLIHGSGLGLWLVHWIATEHDGTVEAVTTDTGTEMRLSVPRVATPTETETLTDVRHARDRYKAGFQESFDAQLLLDDQARIIEANPEAAAIYGLSQPALRGRSLTEFFPEAFGEFWAAFQNADHAREVVTAADVEGQSKQIEYSVATDIVPGQHLLIARDVTDRRRRRDDLERYETVLHPLTDVAWVYDETKRVTFTNQTRMDGVSFVPDELVATPLGESKHLFADPAQFDAWETLVENVLAGDVVAEEMDVAFDVDDGPLVVNLRVAPVPDADDPTGVAVIASDITSRKQRERVLAEYETIVQALGDPVYVIDEHGQFTHVNDELVDLVGYDRETIIGNTPSLFKTADAIDTAEHQLGRLLSADGPDTVDFEVTIQPREAEPVVCEDKMGVLPYENEFNGSVGTLRDVTDRNAEYARVEFLESLATELSQLAGELLQAGDQQVDTTDSLETIGTLVEADRSYVFSVDPDRTVTNTHEWCDDGVEPQRDAFQAVSFDSLPWWLERLETGQTVQNGSELPKATAAEQAPLGREHTAAMVVLPIRSDTELIGFVGFDWLTDPPNWSDDLLRILRTAGELIFGTRDDRRRELEARTQSAAAEQDRANTLFEQLGQPAVDLRIVDAVPVIDTMNEPFEETFAPEKTNGEPLEAGDGEWDEVAERTRTLSTADGDRQFSVRTVPYTVDGQRRAYRIYTDITDREQQKDRFQALIEHSSDIISVIGPNGIHQSQSPSGARILGRTEADVCGTNVFEYVHPEDRDRVMEQFAEAVENPDYTGTAQYRFRHDDGSWVWLESTGTNQLDNPAVEGFVVNSREITEWKQTERRIQRERDRLDEFAGTVSHDLQNPLNVAQGRLRLAREECDSEHLAIAESAHDRMEQLIDEVLSLARAGNAIGDVEPVELAAVVDDCWHHVETNSAGLVIDTALTVVADRTQLKQLVENLLRNAVEHGGDEITVGDTPGGFYLSDNGPGIPKADQQDVLDPGVSTSADGTGFGLSIVRDIADAHGWTVTVTTGPTGGARFEFTGVHDD